MITKIDDVINAIAFKSTNLNVTWDLGVNIELHEDLVVNGFVTVSDRHASLRYSVSGW